jgi:hypothetical protein
MLLPQLNRTGNVNTMFRDIDYPAGRRGVFSLSLDTYPPKRFQQRQYVRQ